jgi:hypothetical protein
LKTIKTEKKITKRETSRIRLIIISYILCFLSSITALEPILIIRKEGESFEKVAKGLYNELSEELAIYEHILNKNTGEEAVITKIVNTKPKLVVLMDNKSISIFKKYQSQIIDPLQMIPSVSLMSVFVEEAISDLKNATGISFEIPIYTSVANLQLLLKKSIRKVGVVHRAFLTGFLKKNELYFKTENIVLATYLISDNKTKLKSNLKKGLKELIKKQEVDALWIPNDNVILQPSLIQEVWLPTLKRNRIPVIVGAKVLVDPKIDLGSFAVLPDYESLGIQAAEIIYSIKDNNWIIESRNIPPPLSVYTIVNLNQVKKYFQINISYLENIDEQIK